MKYMDMVIDESLRLYPAAVFTERVANDDYTYEGMKIPKGAVLVVPIWAIHHDETIYPQAENFIPERLLNNQQK
jgi:cytochrome P450